jgi:hypothetical protein
MDWPHMAILTYIIKCDVSSICGLSTLSEGKTRNLKLMLKVIETLAMILSRVYGRDQ